MYYFKCQPIIMIYGVLRPCKSLMFLYCEILYKLCRCTYNPIYIIKLHNFKAIHDMRQKYFDINILTS